MINPGNCDRGFILVELIAIVVVAVPQYIGHRDDILETVTLENARIIAHAVSAPVFSDGTDVAAAVQKVAVSGKFARSLSNKSYSAPPLAED